MTGNFRSFGNPHTHPQGKKPFNHLVLKAREEAVIINAFLKSNFVIFDNHDFMGFVGETIKNNGSDFVDPTAKVITHGYDIHSIRLLLGEFGTAKDRLFKMVNLRNSDNGWASLEVSGGVFRLVCANGAMSPVRQNGQFQWKHNGTLEHAHTEIPVKLSESAKYANELSLPFAQSQEMKLRDTPTHIIADELEVKSITPSFAKALSSYLEEPEVPKTTVYDMVNAITWTAQHRRLNERYKFERYAVDFLEKYAN